MADIQLWRVDVFDGPDSDEVTECSLVLARSERKGRGGTITFSFGTTEVRDLSGGVFPVDVWRVDIMAGGRKSEELRRTVKKPSAIERAKRDASRGWRAGASESWVELRAPVDPGVEEVPRG